IPKLFNGRNKLLFSGNYESFRKRETITALYSLAPAVVQGGDFSGIANRIFDPTSHVRQPDGTITATAFPGNVLPQTRISPISQKLLEFYRTPILPGVLNNFIEVQTRPVNRDQFILRMAL